MVLAVLLVRVVLAVMAAMQFTLIMQIKLL
jgi:hypothetical protein